MLLNMLVRQTEQHANSQAQVETLIELLLNPSEQQLFQAIRKSQPTRTGPKASRLARHPQGQIIRTIKDVLQDRPEGLSISQIHQLVETALERNVALHSVSACLAEHAGNHFIRIRRGVYRLDN